MLNSAFAACKTANVGPTQTGTRFLCVVGQVLGLTNCTANLTPRSQGRGPRCGENNFNSARPGQWPLPVHNAHIEQFGGLAYKIEPYMILSHQRCLGIDRVGDSGAYFKPNSMNTELYIARYKARCRFWTKMLCCIYSTT